MNNFTYFYAPRATSCGTRISLCWKISLNNVDSHVRWRCGRTFGVCSNKPCSWIPVHNHYIWTCHLYREWCVKMVNWSNRQHRKRSPLLCDCRWVFRLETLWNAFLHMGHRCGLSTGWLLAKCSSSSVVVENVSLQNRHCGFCTKTTKWKINFPTTFTHISLPYILFHAIAFIFVIAKSFGWRETFPTFLTTEAVVSLSMAVAISVFVFAFMRQQMSQQMSFPLVQFSANAAFEAVGTVLERYLRWLTSRLLNRFNFISSKFAVTRTIVVRFVDVFDFTSRNDGIVNSHNLWKWRNIFGTTVSVTRMPTALPQFYCRIQPHFRRCSEIRNRRNLTRLSRWSIWLER